MRACHVVTWACAALLACSGVSATAQEKRGLGDILRASSKAATTIEAEGVERACGARGKALGRKVETGAGRFVLYDTAPGTVAARDFYVTGFKDGCPRRVSGAVAMFGSVELYEHVHYGPIGIAPRGDAFDRAYARLRARTCGGADTACSEREIKRLSKAVTVLSVYPSKGSPARLDVLMNRGALAAVATKH